MPSNYQCKSIDAAKLRLTAAEQAMRDNLAILVRAYEAVRFTRGPQHDAAEAMLGAALARHERPFSHDGHVWQWSRCQQSILRHKAVGMHPMTKHAR